MDNMLISAIIPVYNSAPYLRECIDSILSQTYKNWQVILVDDGSEDNSLDICREYELQDSRIRVFHQENRGQAAARNIGLALLAAENRGGYVTFIDSDDYIHNKTFDKAIVCLKSDKVLGFVQYPYTKGGKKFGKKEKEIYSGHDNLFRLWLDDRTITNYVCDKLWRSEIVIDKRFREGMIFEDRHIFPELLERCDKVAVIPDGMYFYREHDGQTTGRKRDVYFLKSQIYADLHICEYLSPNNWLYSKIWNRAFSNFIELKGAGSFPEIRQLLYSSRPGIANMVSHVMKAGGKFSVSKQAWLFSLRYLFK